MAGILRNNRVYVNTIMDWLVTNSNGQVLSTTTSLVWDTMSVGPVLSRIAFTNLYNANYNRGLWELYGTLPGNTNVLGWLSVQTNMSQDALYSGSQHPFVFFNILPSTLNYDTFMLIQNIRRVATNWVTMGVKADGSVWSSYSDRLDTPQFHVNPLVDVNGDINQSAYRNSVNQLAAANSAAGFNIWGAHYLSFFDANSTDPNFQGASGNPAFHVVVASGADAINTNNASHSGYYHANVSFSGF